MNGGSGCSPGQRPSIYLAKEVSKAPQEKEIKMMFTWSIARSESHQVCWQCGFPSSAVEHGGMRKEKLLKKCRSEIW